MLTVSIAINGAVIFARSAVNTGEWEKDCISPETGQPDDEYWQIYKADTGEVVDHHPADGAVVLAGKLLATIKEPGAARELVVHAKKRKPI